ncbi:MAG: GNAT family N-acetyltransferase [Alphaproteobacteria bacterium]|nr:GNAT family N-acetyltransferase [Alphaproteobacteria bacterium]
MLSPSKHEGFVVPVLETPRLILREHRLEDFPAHAALWADPDVTAQIGVPPRSEEESWMNFLNRPGTWAYMGYGFWAVEEKQSGRFIGAMGFIQARRDIAAPCVKAPEIGWGLAKAFHNRGLGREGTAAVSAWGDANLPSPHTWCIIDPANIASRKLAEGLGYRQTGTPSYKGKTVTLFERTRP